MSSSWPLPGAVEVLIVRNTFLGDLNVFGRNVIAGAATYGGRTVVGLVVLDSVVVGTVASGAVPEVSCDSVTVVAS
jgi:hypothetical protein